MSDSGNLTRQSRLNKFIRVSNESKAVGKTHDLLEVSWHLILPSLRECGIEPWLILKLRLFSSLTRLAYRTVALFALLKQPHPVR